MLFHVSNISHGQHIMSWINGSYFLLFLFPSMVMYPSTPSSISDAGEAYLELLHCKTTFYSVSLVVTKLILHKIQSMSVVKWDSLVADLGTGGK